MNFDFKKVLRPEILDPELTRPDWTQHNERSIQSYWLDKNENTDENLRTYIKKLSQQIDLTSLFTYTEATTLYEKIAKLDNLNPKNLLLTAGSDGAIRSVFESVISPGDKVLHTNPTFAMYYVYSKMFGANEILLDYQAGPSGPRLDLETVTEALKTHNPKLFCLPCPDSPTGTVFKTEELKIIFNTALSTNTLVLIDEAYFPFYEKSVVPYIKDFPNLVVARTFAKAWGVAGLRIGYLATNQNLCELIHKVRPMYEVNYFAVALMEKLVDHVDEIKQSVKRLNDGKKFFEEEMQKLGFPVINTAGNFIHVAFGEKASAIHQRLNNKVLYRKDFGHPSLQGYSRFSAATTPIFEEVSSWIKSAVKESL